MRSYPAALLAFTSAALMAAGAPAGSSQSLPTTSNSVAGVPSVSYSSSSSTVTTTTGSSKQESDAQKYLAYWSIWADVANTPSEEQLSGVTHVVFAFMNVTIPGNPTWAEAATPFSDQQISTIKGPDPQNPLRKVMVAVGGWNNDYPFRDRTKEENREAFVKDIKSFVDAHSLDGVDIDWEYPVDNGESYKYPPGTFNARPSNPADAENLVGFLKALRAAMPDKLISIAVPSRHVDMIAYQMDGIAKGIDASVDWWNVMTYDFLNRRDTETWHHSGGSVMADNIEVYGDQLAIDKKKLLVGFPMYAKWFDISKPCTNKGGLNCTMDVYEDQYGGDLGNSGTATWNTALNTVNVGKFSQSFSALDLNGNSDADAIASSYYDSTNKQFWTWLSPDDILKSCQKYKAEVGGVFFWSLNQDTGSGAGGDHVKALAQCMKG